MTIKRQAVYWALTMSLTAGACLCLVGFYYAAKAAQYASADVVMEGAFLIEKDPEIGFVPVRNGVSLRRHPKLGLSYHVFTNKRRARVNAAGLMTPPQVDILTVGCSFSWGHGIENPQTYTELLAKRFAVPVANASFASYGTLQSLQMLRRNADLKPKLVIYGFTDDHPRRNLAPCAPNYGPHCLSTSHVAVGANGAPVIEPPDLAYFDANRLFWTEFFFEKKSILRRTWLAARADWVRTHPRNEHALQSDLEFRRRSLEYLLGELRSTARSMGAAIILVRIPSAHASLAMRGSSEHTDTLRVVEEGVFLMDLGPVWAEHLRHRDNPPLGFGTDYHPNAIAHGLIANELAQLIRVHGLLGRELGSGRPASVLEARP